MARERQWRNKEGHRRHRRVGKRRRGLRRDDVGNGGMSEGRGDAMCHKSPPQKEEPEGP